MVELISFNELLQRLCFLTEQATKQLSFEFLSFDEEIEN
jgi:hypothetical protein